MASPAVGSDKESLRRRLVAVADQPADKAALAEAALLIAAEHQPGLDIRAALEKLDRLAAEAAARLAARRRAGQTFGDRVVQLNRWLFEEAGFSGNEEEFYDPRNSYLNLVLERRTGIPITLAIVQIEIARRLGLQARGVAFPAHFLLRYERPGPATPGHEKRSQETPRDEARAGAKETESGPLIVDPFSGEVLSQRQCELLLQAVLGPSAALEPGLLAPATAQEILVRMLRNLKQIFLTEETFADALACCDRVLLLQPDSAAELRDRGLLLERMECMPEALADLERALALAPEEPWASAVREHLATLRSRLPRVN